MQPRLNPEWDPSSQARLLRGIVEAAAAGRSIFPLQQIPLKRTTTSPLVENRHQGAALGSPRGLGGSIATESFGGASTPQETAIRYVRSLRTQAPTFLIRRFSTEGILSSNFTEVASRYFLISEGAMWL